MQSKDVGVVQLQRLEPPIPPIFVCFHLEAKMPSLGALLASEIHLSCHFLCELCSFLSKLAAYSSFFNGHRKAGPGPSAAHFE